MSREYARVNAKGQMLFGVGEHRGTAPRRCVCGGKLTEPCESRYSYSILCLKCKARYKWSRHEQKGSVDMGWLDDKTGTFLFNVNRKRHNETR